MTVPDRLHFFSLKYCVKSSKNDTEEEDHLNSHRLPLVMIFKMYFPAQLLTIGSAVGRLALAVRGHFN